MPQSLEERVAYLEGKVEEQTRGFGDLTIRITSLDQKVDRFRAELSSRMDALDQKIDRFREELSRRIDALDQKIDRFRDELSARMDRMDSRFDMADAKTSRQFMWLVGLQMATMLAIIGALLQN